MDKNARKILFIAVYAIGFFALIMAMWTLFANFTIGKGAYDASMDAKASLAEAGKYTYWLSGAGFFILLPFAAGCLLTCFSKRLPVSVLTAVYGLLALTALIVMTAVSGGVSYNDSGSIMEDVYLVISTFQLSLMQAIVPVAILTALAIVLLVKNKKEKSAETDGETKEKETDA